MTLLLTLFNETPFFLLPAHWSGWLGLILWVGMIGFALLAWRRYGSTWGPKEIGVFILCCVVALFASFFLGIRLPAWSRLPLPGVTLEPGGLPLMIFSALPWVLAGGFLGPVASVVLALFVGLGVGYWGTHTLFTALELATMSVLWSVAMQQRYRTWFFRSLRHPFVSAIFLSLISPLLFVVSSLFFVGGSLAIRLDYAITNVGASSLAVAGPVLLAGFMAEFFKLAFPAQWGGQSPYQPSPAEKSLEVRYFQVFAPSLVFLLIVFIVGDWVIAGKAVRQILRSHMASSADAVSESIPYFLNTGQNLIVKIASDPELDLNSPETISHVLEDSLRMGPYFQHFLVLNQQGEIILKYPDENVLDAPATPEENIGIDMALNGVPVQFYTLSPREDTESAQISFFGAISTEEGGKGVLIGRTELVSNPFAQSVLSGLGSVSDVGGLGLLVGDDGTVLYQSAADFEMQTYRGDLSDEAEFYDGAAPDGTRQLIHYHPVVGQPWGVVLMTPARQAQQLALNIAAPLLGVILLLAGLAFVLMRFSFGIMTSSLKGLAGEAELIAEGYLDHPVEAERIDEIGRLRKAFERMRRNLKANLDELNRLLSVSQGVASNLELEEAIRPILEAALSLGADSARLVVAKDILPKNGKSDNVPIGFGEGKLATPYSHFDDWIISLMETNDQDCLILDKTNQPSLRGLGSDAPKLETGIVVALWLDQTFLGTCWIGYDHPHEFTGQEIQFLTALASHAEVAITNARLYMVAEDERERAKFERERLSAILLSTPNPVLATDQYGQLQLINPAACKAIDIKPRESLGRRVDQIIPYEELVAILSPVNRSDLLRISDEQDGNKKLVEIRLSDGQVYVPNPSSITLGGKVMGRVCVLQNVTHFKKLDDLKSEFVSQVSHDLRSPLTLMRGYATMLFLVGDLNEKQSDYIDKIVIGVENMSNLVDNLLDLGRIEAGFDLKLEKFKVEDIIDRVFELLSNNCQRKKIQLHKSVDALVTAEIEAEKALLQQALFNLIDNAIKYTPEGGDIWVRVKPWRDKVFFEVEDTGIGISSSDLPHVFDKFYRSPDRRSKKEQGTGLGLAIVKSIVERHGGTISVESKIGKGSVFSFRIPTRQSQ